LALAEFKRGFAFIAAVLGGGQLFLHLIFSYESAPSIVVTEPGHAVLVRSGGGHAAKAAETATAYAPQAADVASWGSTVSWGSTMSWGSTVSWGSTMTLAHIGAMLVAAALMAHGERAVWRLAHMVLPLLWVWLSPVAPFVARPRPVSEPAAFVPRFGALLARNRPRRGPPLYGLS
jgi:hypothetical protein